jgi:N-acetylglutamate synthase-like GNAT family acetyltransferase
MTKTLHASATLRPATRLDEAAVEALLTASHLPLDGVRDALPHFVVADEDGEIVGVAGIETCGTEGEYALLRSVAVAPSWQKRGLGRALVTRAITDAEARGISALYLLTTTADGYFPSFGFVTTTRDSVPAAVRATAEFQGACPASAIVMVRGSAEQRA